MFYDVTAFFMLNLISGLRREICQSLVALKIVRYSMICMCVSV